MSSEELLQMCDVTGITDEEIDPELLAELQREVERHEAAKRMLKQREQEAIEAKMRAARSQMTVEEMTTKFETVKQKLDVSRQSLQEAKLQSESRERVVNTINSLRVRAEILLKKHEQQVEAKSETATKIINLSSISESTDEETLRKLKSKVDFGQTIIDLQEKLVKNAQQQPTQQPLPSTPVTTSATPTQDCQTEQTEPDGAVASPDEATEPEVEGETDINAMVQRLEAKCANVREELGRMAVSEQYMRTKQAQLIAKRKEKEALEAELKAAIKEKEAQDMRRKVEELTQLLAARKAKLRATETIAEKKAAVVEKVEKILNRKERHANFIEKQKMDAMVFDKKVKKN